MTSPPGMRVLSGIPIALLLAAAATPVAAQEGCAPAADTARAPTVLIQARARLGALTFAAPPQARVGVGGCPAPNAIISLRGDLPRPVRPGVTYRDLDVAIEIRTNLHVLCSPTLQSLLAGSSEVTATRIGRLCESTVPSDTIGTRP